MSSDRLDYLLDRFIRHEATQEETEELALWIDAMRDDREWRERLEAIWWDFQGEEALDPERSEKILGRVLRDPQQEIRSVPSPIVEGAGKWWAIAAAVAVLISAGGYILFQGNRGARQEIFTSAPSPAQDIRPGGNKAVLTLANGQKIVLDSAPTGAFAAQGAVRIVKLDSGRLAYQGGAAGPSGPVAFNTLSTPRGGQYEVILPDGSRVWLNAASTLTFPTAFRGGERKVTLRGEGYFEVAPPPAAGKNGARPFTVAVETPSRTAEVTVLGTHFNINAYQDDPVIRTTLLEGAILVKGSGQPRGYRLTPGQQAIIDSGSVQIASDVNTDEAIAWKNGLFDFEGIDIRSVMRQVSRWYDVDIRYQTRTSAHFVGTISRNGDISGVLHLLEMTGAVHFRVDGRTVTVL